MKTLRLLARSKRSLGVNTLLAGLSVGFSIYIVWEMTAPLGPSIDTPPAPVSVPPSSSPTSRCGPLPPFTRRSGAGTCSAPPAPTPRRSTPGDAAEPLRRGPGRRSVHRRSGGSRQQAGVRLPAREFSGRWTIRAIESSHIVLERRNPRLEVQLIHDPSRPKPSLPVVVASAEGFETAARPVGSDSRTDTVSSATLSTPPAAPPLAARPPVSSFGIVAPAVPRAR